MPRCHIMQMSGFRRALQLVVLVSSSARILYQMLAFECFLHISINAFALITLTLVHSSPNKRTMKQRSVKKLPMPIDYCNVTTVACHEPCSTLGCSLPANIKDREKRVQKGKRSKTKENAYHTRGSQAVSDPSTNRARRCLTCEIRRVRVHSTRCGGRRGAPAQARLYGALRVHTTVCLNIVNKNTEHHRLRGK